MCHQDLSCVEVVDGFDQLVAHCPWLRSALLERLAVVKDAADTHGRISRDIHGVTVGHHSAQILHRHLLHQILCTFCRSVSPVFVDVQGTVPVVVLEGMPVLIQDFHVAVSECRSSFLRQYGITFMFGDSVLLRASCRHYDNCHEQSCDVP